MGRLLVINGLPASGKSTPAARYVADRPLSLCLDIDMVRELLGRWKDAPDDAGHLARRLAPSMARDVLLGGRDVVVPRLLARIELERRRPAALTIGPIPGDIDATYRALLAILELPPERA